VPREWESQHLALISQHFALILLSIFDWLANLPFVAILAIAVGLYALLAFIKRHRAIPVKTKRSAGEFVESLLFAWVVVFVILKPFFVQAFYIPSGSMIPSLQIGDRLLVAKLPYWFRGPERGEVVVFKAPPNAGKDGVEQDYIKRLIGLPGEKLAVIGGKVYINGHPLNEPYTEEPSARDYGPIIIPPEHYFMMGDNRNNSADSRYWGPLDKDRIVGTAWFRFWPLDKIGFLHRPPYPNLSEKPQPALGIWSLVH
jgi:signal peptidase I